MSEARSQALVETKPARNNWPETKLRHSYRQVAAELRHQVFMANVAERDQTAMELSDKARI